MPSGCTVFIDEHKPEHCRVNFDAHTYDRDEIKSLFDRFLRLLERIAEAPELESAKLTMIARLETLSPRLSRVKDSDDV
jgi:hypothetical protein